MAEFAVNFGFLAQEYNTWFADEHGHEPRVTFDIFASRGTYLCGSESFLKAICRAKKSTHLVRMEQMAVHIVLILKRSRHMSFPIYVARYDSSNSGFDAFKPLEYRVLYEPSLENKQK